jgi:hypothetical protein
MRAAEGDLAIFTPSAAFLTVAISSPAPNLGLPAHSVVVAKQRPCSTD